MTGLYPEHHGIVANTFYDPFRKEAYSLANPAATGNEKWYGGTPLWVLAEHQGIRTACFFWPTSDADIQGTRPSYYLAPYQDNFPGRQARRTGAGMAEASRGAKTTFYRPVLRGYGSRRPHVRAGRAGNR